MLTETVPAYCSSQSTDTNAQFQMEAQEQRPSSDSEETPSTGEGFLIPSALEKINSGCLWKCMRRTNPKHECTGFAHTLHTQPEDDYGSPEHALLWL